MAESLESLEERMAALRAAVRQAVRAGDKAAATQARRELRAVETAWNDALESEEPAEQKPESPDNGAVEAAAPRPVAAIPVREQVHQSLTILGASAAPKLISAVHEAFFSDAIVTTKLASLRRDEERSFVAQGHARPYYICAALTFDRLAPARGLLAVSTWPLEQRIVGPLSPRTDFLTQATRIAEQIQRVQATGRAPSDAAWRLLRRFALNIPGAHDGYDDPEPEQVIRAARTETEVHTTADADQRREAATRARSQLSDAQQLFGAPQLGLARSAASTDSE